MKAQRAILCWNILISLIKHKMQMMNLLEYKQRLTVSGFIVH